jgi:hypothetical protein
MAQRLELVRRVTAADDGNEGVLRQPPPALSIPSPALPADRGRYGRQCPALAVWRSVPQ